MHSAEIFGTPSGVDGVRSGGGPFRELRVGLFWITLHELDYAPRIWVISRLHPLIVRIAEPNIES
jgi:hypothetical protein